VPPLAESPALAAPPPAPPRVEIVPKPPSLHAERPSEKMPTQRIIALGVGAVGVVGLGLGAFFGLRASGTLSDAEALCDARFCTAEGLSLRDDAKSQANVSTVAFAASGVAVAGAAALWLLAPKSQPRASRSGSGGALVPQVTTGGAVLGAIGRF